MNADPVTTNKLRNLASALFVHANSLTRSTSCFLLDKEEWAFSLVVMAPIMKNSDDLQDFGPYFLGQNP